MLRHLSTFVLEILPLALACLIGAFLLAGHLGAPPVRGEGKVATPIELVAGISSAEPALAGHLP